MKLKASRRVLFAASALALLVRCASPTAIRVAVHSEVPCHSGDAVLVGGSNLAELASKAPAGTSTSCAKSDDGTFALGDIVITPVGDKTSEVAFQAMARPDGQPADTCNDPVNAPFCIVARRQLHFSKHEELALRIDLRLSCLGKVCPGDQTCVRGACVSANITSCSGTCDESALSGPGGPPPPLTDAGGDSGADATSPPAGPLYFSPLAVGAAHTCAIRPTGVVKCWGDNSHGELGNESFAESHVPVAVLGVTNAVSLAAGLNFTCALIRGGTVKCWGKNDYGELGNKKNTDSPVAVDVQNLTGASSIATGCKHVCASKTSGEVKCWGWNSHGQVGNNTVMNQNLPVDVIGAAGALFVTAGFEFSCAAYANGVKCWGDNASGQLANGGVADSHVPVSAAGITWSPLVLSAGANHVIAFGSSSMMPQAASWGQNVGMGGLTSVDNATAGEGYNCALRGGGVVCWGQNNLGQLGNASTTPSAAPVVPVGLGSGVRAVRAGYEHACAMMSDDRIRCWGKNANGELGNNTTAESHVPVDVVPN